MADKKVIFDVLAVAKTEGFDAAAAKVNKLNDSAEKSTKNLGLLSTAIVGLGPAVIPVAAAASVALVGLAGAAGTGLLAFEGLKKEWKAGTLQLTPLGQQITTLTRNLDTLERTAAGGVAPGFTQGLKDINGLMPTVNQDVRQLAGQLGQIGGHLGAGFVTLFTRLNPLFTALGDELVRDSAQFQRWATSSTAVTKFVNYAQQQLPRVEETIKSLFTLASHVVEAFAGFGGNSLTAIQLFSKALNLIPVGVLQALVPAIVGLKIASTVSAAVNNLTISLEKVTVAEGAAAAATGLLATTLSAALNPAIAATIGLYYLLGPVLDKVAGNTGTFSDQVNTLRGATVGVIPPADHFVNGVLVPYGKQVSVAADGTVRLTTTQQAGKDAADKAAASFAKQTVQMELQSDAAGLLNQALQQLGNQNLGVAQAQTALAQANLNVLSTFKGSHNAISGNTAAALANQQAIQGSIQSAYQLASAIGKQTGSTKQEIASLKNSKAQLEDTLRSQGRLTKGVQAYIDQLFQIPKKIPPTKVDLDKAAADAKAAAWKRQLNTIPPNVFTKFNANTRQALKNARDFSYYLSTINGQTATTYVDNYIRTHVSAFVSGNVGRVSGLRAAGGPVTAGMPYIVGERRPELFVPDVNGRIIPNPGPTRTRGVAQSVTNNVVINVYGGDTNQVVRALERHVGSGGKIRIARGVN
jgi:hypothetical protein